MIQRNQTNNGGNLRKWNKIPSKFKFKKVGQLHESKGSWRKMGTTHDLVEVGPSKVVRQWMKLHILIGQSKKTGTLDEHWEVGQSKEMRKGMKLGEVGQLDNLKKVGQCMNPRK